MKTCATLMAALAIGILHAEPSFTAVGRVQYFTPNLPAEEFTLTWISTSDGSAFISSEGHEDGGRHLNFFSAKRRISGFGNERLAAFVAFPVSDKDRATARRDYLGSCTLISDPEWKQVSGETRVLGQRAAEFSRIDGDSERRLLVALDLDCFPLQVDDLKGGVLLTRHVVDQLDTSATPTPDPLLDQGTAVSPDKFETMWRTKFQVEFLDDQTLVQMVARHVREWRDSKAAVTSTTTQPH